MKQTEISEKPVYFFIYAYSQIIKKLLEDNAPNLETLVVSRR